MKRSVWLVLNLLVACLFLGAHFLPLYSVPDGAAATDLFSYISAISGTTTSLAGFLIFASIGVALEIAAIVFLTLAAIHGERQFEKSDKRFGFGIVIFAMAGAELALTNLGLKLNYMLFVNLVEALLAILFMFLHFRYYAFLSDRRKDQ